MKNKILKLLTKSGIEPISGMDATFLYGETPTSPMDVGSVAIIEGSLKYETFRKIIASRLHLIPKLRKRLMYVPMSIDYPYWVDDPNFDIDLHLHHVALPKPGGWKELRAIASDIYSEPLDHSRPLWSFTFIEGLDNVSQVPKGSVAVVSKIHHVAIDGVAGAGILALIFDMTPEKKEIPEPKPFKPKPLPNELQLVLNSAVTFAQNPLKLPRLIREALGATVKAGFITRAQKAALPTAPFTAPHTPLNGLLASRRKWNAAILSLDRVKKLKVVMGTSLNDIILAICAGALRRYLDEKGKLPARPLVAMVPISTRTESEANSMSNQVSSMLVQLATNVEDPIERLQIIHENTIRGKTYQGAIGAKTLAKMAEVVPFGIANQASRLYSRFHLSELHNPVFNLTITNVPGPQFPLYINGHKLLSIMGKAPIIDGMGLIITVFSYNGTLTISPTTDVNSMPDVRLFTKYIRESANELESAILSSEKEQKETKTKKPSKPESDELFAKLKKQLKAQPELAKDISGVYQFHVNGTSDTYWKIDLNKKPGQVVNRKSAKADVTFTIADEHLKKIADDKLSVETAFIQGRLKVLGDMDLAMKFGGFLTQLIK